MIQTRTYRPTEDELALLAQVIRAVTARVLLPDDARDFSQSVPVRLLETDYELFRRFRGQSSLRTYLTVVVSRLLQDWQNPMARDTGADVKTLYRRCDHVLKNLRATAVTTLAMSRIESSPGPR